MDGTVITQGSFLASVFGGSVVAVPLNIPSGVDWLKVYNYTQAGIDGAANTGVEFYWQRGMPAGGGIVKYKTVAGVAALSEDTLVSGGFTLLDTSVQQPGTVNALTAITAANPPIVSSVNLPPLGSVVRLFNLNNQPQVGGLDFTVTDLGVGSFEIGNISLVNSTASTSGSWRLIPFDPIFYPRRRAITFVRSASQAVIYLSVTHQFVVGQSVRLAFPGGSSVWGNYAALDGVQCTILAVNVARAGSEPNSTAAPNNILVDVDTSALGAWNVFGAGLNQAYPPASSVPFSPAQVVPQGEDSAVSLSSNLNQVAENFDGSPVLGANNGLLSDATINLAFMGMLLGTGGDGTALGAAISGPAGSADSDLMFWVAGKSTAGGL